MITTIIIFIIVLGVLVFVHEFGHFIVARKSGMKVDEFGFGFPPRLFGFQKKDGKLRFIKGHKNPTDSDETVYSINWIPFGGFVKIMGENNEHEQDPRSFVNRPFWGRFATLVAGVTMNWILAVLLFAVAFMVGVTSEVTPGDASFANAKITQKQVAISYIVPGEPAEKAGLVAGDIILSIDGKEFSSYEEVQQYVRANRGKVFEFKVKRISEEKNVSVASLENPSETQGPTGVALTNIATVKLPFFASLKLGFVKAVNMTKAIFVGLGSLFTSREALNQVGGPIKIAQLTGQVAALGLVPLLHFTGLLSINLAILNIMPFPALDGGRLLFLIIEKLRGKKNNQKIEQYFNTFGFVFLLLLMVVVTIKDIVGK